MMIVYIYGHLSYSRGEFDHHVETSDVRNQQTDERDSFILLDDFF